MPKIAMDSAPKIKNTAIGHLIDDIFYGISSGVAGFQEMNWKLRVKSEATRLEVEFKKFATASRDARICVSTCISESTQMGIITAGSVDQYCRIEQLSATCTFPGVEGADKVIKLFGKHAAFTAWTLHKLPPDFYKDTVVTVARSNISKHAKKRTSLDCFILLLYLSRFFQFFQWFKKKFQFCILFFTNSINHYQV